MKIGYLVSLYPAPSHTFIRREIAALRSRGVDIAVFSIRRPPGNANYNAVDRSDISETVYIQSSGYVRVLWFNLLCVVTSPSSYLSSLGLALEHRPPGIKALVWSLFHFVEAMVLALEIKRSSAVHLHCHFANSAATVGLVASRFLNIPFSLTLHGISETDYPSGLLLSKKVKLAAFVACASYYIRAQAMRLIDASYWSKMKIVRCVLETSTLPAKQDRKLRKFRFVAVGRLSEEKGYIGMLRAFSQVIRSSAAELLIVGEGDQRAVVEAEIQRLGIDDNVTMLGSLPEEATLRAIADSDVLVLASFAEGLPVVLMEAVAIGVPVIASCVAGIPELITHNDTGLLFAPSDWDVLAAHMELLLLKPDERERLSRRARKFFAEKFDKTVAINVMSDLLSAEK